MHSCIYEGQVRHRRFQPVRHEFSYRLFLMYLDLDELPTLFAGRLFWADRRPAIARFVRSDHLGDPAVPLRQAVCELVEAETGRRPVGPIRLLTHLRYFGYAMNPISLYYCFSPSGERVETVVAEVSNTPWGERHCYVLPVDPVGSPAGRLKFQFDKQMHVSPFLEMALRYQMTATEPRKRLAVQLDAVRGDEPLVDATLALRRREITGAALASVLVRYPLMTLQVVAAIYFEAWRLWWKKCPAYPHPAAAPKNAEIAKP